MKDHYSTVDQHEQRDGIGLVLSRVKAEGVDLARTSVAKDQQQTSEQLTAGEEQPQANEQNPTEPPHEPAS